MAADGLLLLQKSYSAPSRGHPLPRLRHKLPPSSIAHAMSCLYLAYFEIVIKQLLLYDIYIFLEWNIIIQIFIDNPA